MSDNEVEIDLLRERLNEYRELLQVSHQIIFNPHTDTEKKSIIKNRYKNKLLEHGIIEDERNDSGIQL